MAEQLVAYPLDVSLLTERVDVSAGIAVRARVGLGNESYGYGPARVDDELEVMLAQEKERQRRESLVQNLASTMLVGESD